MAEQSSRINAILSKNIWWEASFLFISKKLNNSKIIEKQFMEDTEITCSSFAWQKKQTPRPQNKRTCVQRWAFLINLLTAKFDLSMALSPKKGT